MTTALNALHALNVARAGDTYTWPAGGTSRPRSDAFPGLLAWLAIEQNGICPACGDALGMELLNVNHLISQGKRQGGYVEGNIYLGHRECNELDAELFGMVVPVESLARPDMVATTYPTRATMLALAPSKGRKGDRRTARLARMAG